jgi:epoxyqueuosine reductase QueG
MASKMTIHDAATGAKSDPNADDRLSDEFRDYLLAQGADLVGFGLVSHMEGAPAIMQPRRYLPDAQSMISIGLHINEASCDLIERSVRDGRLPASYHSYQLFTLAIVNPQLDTIAFQGARFLENLGYRAYPFPANVPHISKPSAEYPGGPGDISHKHVAVACGLGQIGWHNLLITPKFGTRQKLTTIITNAPLDPDPMCEDRLCSRCFQCAHACPTAAIPVDPRAKTTIAMRGRPVEYAKIVGWRCRWGCSGMLQSAGGYKDIAMPDEEPSAEELLQHKAQMDPWQVRLKATSGGLLPYCGRCLCACPAKRGSA